MRRQAWILGLIMAAGLVFGVFGDLSARASEASDFYKGKTLTWMVSTGPGGGHDFYARLIARHMAKFIPDTTIIVKNVPGAGHIIGANTVYLSKPDGLTIGSFSTGLVYAQLVEMQGIQFDLAKMSWIGKAASDSRVMMVTKKSGDQDSRRYARSQTASVVCDFRHRLGLQYRSPHGHARLRAELQDSHRVRRQ